MTGRRCHRPSVARRPLRVHGVDRAHDARGQRAQARRQLCVGGVARSATDDPFSGGSNTWTIGPAHSANGHAMLLINPHLAWGNTFYRYMEVHQVGPNYDLVRRAADWISGRRRRLQSSRGLGTHGQHHRHRGFLQADRAGRPVQSMTGSRAPFERSTKTLKIKQPDGTFTEESLEIRKSLQGPVVYDKDGVDGRDARRGTRSPEDARTVVPDGRSHGPRRASRTRCA